MKRYISDSPEETTKIAKELGSCLYSNTVIALFGDLGAGKTTFIKGLVMGACECDPGIVQSPTFTYLNIYPGKKTIYHFDLYRLHDIDQFLSMGFDEYFDANGICCIEWAERIAAFLPDDVIKIRLEHIGEESRQITIES